MVKFENLTLQGLPPKSKDSFVYFAEKNRLTLGGSQKKTHRRIIHRYARSSSRNLQNFKTAWRMCLVQKFKASQKKNRSWCKKPLHSFSSSMWKLRCTVRGNIKGCSMPVACGKLMKAWFPHWLPEWRPATPPLWKVVCAAKLGISEEWQARAKKVIFHQLF